MRQILLTLFFAAATEIALAGPIGYVINFSGQFGTMDLSTGAFTPLGSGVPSNSAGGLAGSRVSQAASKANEVTAMQRSIMERTMRRSI